MHAIVAGEHFRLHSEHEERADRELSASVVISQIGMLSDVQDIDEEAPQGLGQEEESTGLPRRTALEVSRQPPDHVQEVLKVAENHPRPQEDQPGCTLYSHHIVSSFLLFDESSSVNLMSELRNGLFFVFFFLRKDERKLK